MSKTLQSVRKIKCLGSCVEKGEAFLHPITLKLTQNTSYKKCPSELHYINGETHYTVPCNTNNISHDIQKFMALPYLNLNLEQMLNIYKINTIDSLLKWTDNMIQDKRPFQYVNRIINIWIKFNYNDLIKNNKILVRLYDKIGSHYWKDVKIINLEQFIKKWFKTKNYEDFVFDMGTDLYNYLHDV